MDRRIWINGQIDGQMTCKIIKYFDKLQYLIIIMVKLQERGAASDDLELGIYCQGRGPE